MAPAHHGPVGLARRGRAWLAVRDRGVRGVRFTAGAPLLRPGLVGIVAACAELAPRPELSLTTN
ncbi:hypothetical protein UK12_35190, partial [Saccharothrix sp. ST-888]